MCTVHVPGTVQPTGTTYYGIDNATFFYLPNRASLSKISSPTSTVRTLKTKKKTTSFLTTPHSEWNPHLIQSVTLAAPESERKSPTIGPLPPWIKYRYKYMIKYT
jgi:hypothetical protein